METHSPVRHNILKPTLQLAALYLTLTLSRSFLSLTSTNLLTSSEGLNLPVLVHYAIYVIPFCLFCAVFAVFYRFNRMKLYFYGLCIFYITAFLVSFILLNFFREPFPAELNFFVIFLKSIFPSSILLLFWVSANQQLSFKQALICYPLVLVLSTLANHLLASVAAVITMPSHSYENIHEMFYFLLLSQEPWTATFQISTSACLMLAALFLCLSMVIFGFFFQRQDLSASPSDASMSIKEKANYLIPLAVIFLGFGLAPRFISQLMTTRSPEVWIRFSPSALLLYLPIWFAIILLTGWVAWAAGWRVAALFTPVLGLGLALGLLIILWVGTPFTFERIALAETLNVAFSALCGFLAVITKESALIPLPASTKARARAFFVALVVLVQWLFSIANFDKKVLLCISAVLMCAWILAAWRLGSLISARNRLSEASVSPAERS